MKQVSRESAAGAGFPFPMPSKLSVADTGPGIPAEYHIEVFDDFFRMPTTESQTDGMGLGLAIARRLVNAMGGKDLGGERARCGLQVFLLAPA